VPPPVHIVPLGGLGEVGMNCLAIEAAGRIAVVDCGVLFTDEPFGIDVLTPDLGWLVERKQQVGAIFLTHGHEDHVGALPFLLRHLTVPVYGTRFTLAMVKGRLAEAGISADLREVVPGDVRPAGEASPLAAEFIAVTHSIPDACALAFTTPQGVVIHSGDFKIDERPVRGPHMDLDRFAELGRAGVRLLLSDSTNSERPGWARSESAVGPGLHDVMAEAAGRVFVATFSSNAHRLQQVVEAAAACGRRLALLGRGMVENFEVAKALGYLVEPGWMPVSADEARRLPPRELAILTTGSQGEPRAALGRLSRGEHRELAVHAGDTVILSSRQIPGNELAVGRLVNELCARGALVRWDGHPPLHATGHAQEDEQRRLIQLTRPERFVPIHGEYRQLARHAATAASEGLAPGRCHLLTDGQVLELDDAGARVLPSRVHSGRVAVTRDEGGTVEVPDAVVADRRRLAESGLVVAVVQVDAATGAVVAGPEFHARGVAGLEGRETELRAEVLAALGGVGGGEALREALRLSVRRWFRRATGRRPVVEPVVLTR